MLQHPQLICFQHGPNLGFLNHSRLMSSRANRIKGSYTKNYTSCMFHQSHPSTSFLISHPSVHHQVLLTCKDNLPSYTSNSNPTSSHLHLEQLSQKRLGVVLGPCYIPSMCPASCCQTRQKIAKFSCFLSPTGILLKSPILMKFI